MAYSPLLTKALTWTFDKPYEEREDWARFVYINNKLVKGQRADVTNDVQMNAFINTTNQAMKAFILFEPFKSPRKKDERMAKMTLEYHLMQDLGRHSFLILLGKILRMNTNQCIYEHAEKWQNAIVPFPTNKIKWGIPEIVADRMWINYAENLQKDNAGEFSVRIKKMAEDSLNDSLEKFPRFMKNENRLCRWGETVEVFA